MQFRSHRVAAVTLAVASLAFSGQQSGWRKADEPAPAASTNAQQTLNDAQIQDIITRFAAKETEFARARENYTYRQTARVQELDSGGAVTGQWEMISDIVFSPEGKRTERVVRAPTATLHNILLTPEDEQDLRNVQPFVLTTAEIPKYDVRYLGIQKADEVPCYVFAVKPKKMEKGQRYFQGEIWVDDRDLQIVKSYGRGVGIVKGDNQFPKFETIRDQIDGKYWFPVWTNADDVLYFQAGPQRIGMRVTYKDYKQFKSDVNIQYGSPVESNPPAPEPKKP